MSQTIQQAVDALLKRLGLTDPALVVLFNSAEIADQVKIEGALIAGENPTESLAESILGNLAYREVSRRFYTACQPPVAPSNPQAEELRNLAGQQLGLLFYRWAWRKVGSTKPEQAEDIANEALAKVFEKLDTCRSAATFLKWAEQIVIHLAYENSHKYHQQAHLVENSDEEKFDLHILNKDTVLIEEIADPEEGPEAKVLTQETRQELLEAIARLKTTTKRASYYKQILEGKYLQALSYAELAERLNLNIVEVHKMHYEALRLLRRDKEWLRRLRPSDENEI